VGSLTLSTSALNLTQEDVNVPVNIQLNLGNTQQIKRATSGNLSVLVQEVL
jgi:hypothetical protein